MTTYSKYHQLYYYKHRKEIKEKTKEYRKEYYKLWYDKHKEEILAKRRAKRLAQKAEPKELEQTNQSDAVLQRAI